MSIQEPALRDRIESGATIEVRARTFGGLTTARVTNARVETDIWPWNAFTNLDGESWAFRAYEPRLAEDANREATWYVLCGDERANISFGRNCAENGAFSTVYLDAFSVV